MGCCEHWMTQNRRFSKLFALATTFKGTIIQKGVYVSIKITARITSLSCLKFTFHGIESTLERILNSNVITKIRTNPKSSREHTSYETGRNKNNGGIKSRETVTFRMFQHVQ